MRWDFPIEVFRSGRVDHCAEVLSIDDPLGRHRHLIVMVSGMKQREMNLSWHIACELSAGRITCSKESFVKC